MVSSYSASRVRWQKHRRSHSLGVVGPDQVAKALGTSIAKLVPTDQTWKVAFVVAGGVLVAHIVSSERDTSVFLRLVAKSSA